MTRDRTLTQSSLAELDPALCDRYLAGECTPEDLQQIETWIAGSADRAVALRKLRRGFAALIDYPALPSASEVVTRVNAVVTAQARTKSNSEQQQSRVPTSRVSKQWDLGTHPLRRAMWYGLMGAAVCAIFLMVGQWSGSRRVNATLATHGLTYTTAKGQRATITLPDGSTVMLNVASRLQVPADYAVGNQTLQLTGEALFTVVHHARSALTVTSGGVTTRVLGTSFLVRHYPEDTATVVAVRDGKVSVRTRVLAAMQQGEITAQGATAIRPTNPSQFSFATGMLTVDDVPLRDAIVELNRWYDLDIRLGDVKLATRRIGGVFAAGAQSDLMAILEESMHLRVVREGRVVILYPRAGT